MTVGSHRAASRLTAAREARVDTSDQTASSNSENVNSSTRNHRCPVSKYAPSRTNGKSDQDRWTA